MIIIKGENRKSIALAEYINNNVGQKKRVVLFDSIQVPNLQFHIKRDYGHYMFEHSFEELLDDLKNETAQELIKNTDVIVFMCHVTMEQLDKFDESQFSQDIIITAQTEDNIKIYDTKNV